MATRTQIVKTDDINGQEGAETVTFAYDGVEYSIDLVKENRDALESALAPFIEKAENSSRPDAKKVREWASKNGYEIAARGRIPNEVYKAYAKGRTKVS